MLRRLMLALAFTAFPLVAFSSTQEIQNIRGKAQTLHLYGNPGNPSAIVSSGDAGWHGLGPVLAEYLAGAGYFVVGVDSKSYLESFTEKDSHLTTSDVPGDFEALVDYATNKGKGKPVLIGVSEGAGLSVLAATNTSLKAKLGGVLALGLPDQNELAWRLRDMVIWVTKKVPKEPLFSVKAIISQVGPVPLAVIHSSQDEFISADEEKAMFALAQEPKKLWILESEDHSFKDKRPELNQTVSEALTWMKSNR